MKDLVQYLASSLVDDPNAVLVTEKECKGGVTYCLTVKQEDLGKVIGKKGRTAKAMRTLLMTLGMRQKRRILLDILEPHKSVTTAEPVEQV